MCLGTLTKLGKATASFVMSVIHPPAWNNVAPFWTDFQEI
jgi:hypothetical protein